MQQPGNFQKPSLTFVCGQDWNGMQPCQEGRFCGSCRKTVVDFTQKSVAEVREMLAQRDGEVCGRFYAHQLDQPVRKGFSFSQVFTSLLVLFGLSFLSREAEAQSKKAPLKKKPVTGSEISQPEICKPETAQYLKQKQGKVKRVEVLTGEVMPLPVQNQAQPVNQPLSSGKPVGETNHLEPNPPFITANPEVMPAFKNGGDAGLQKFLKENKKVIRDEAEGLVVLSFVIDTLGTVQDIKVLKNLSPATTQEALRLASLLTFEPGFMHGKKVSVRYTLPIRFDQDN